jgi:hypothetical protein
MNQFENGHTRLYAGQYIKYARGNSDLDFYFGQPIAGRFKSKESTVRISVVYQVLVDCILPTVSKTNHFEIVNHSYTKCFYRRVARKSQSSFCYVCFGYANFSPRMVSSCRSTY